MPSQKESSKQLAVAIAAVTFSLGAPCAVCAQENVWSNPSADAWLDGANLSRGFYLHIGTDSGGATATFKSTTVSGSVLGIDFSTLVGNTLDLTWIDFHAASQPLTIGNSSNMSGGTLSPGVGLGTLANYLHAPSKQFEAFLKTLQKAKWRITNVAIRETLGCFRPCVE